MNPQVDFSTLSRRFPPSRRRLVDSVTVVIDERNSTPVTQSVEFRFGIRDSDEEYIRSLLGHRPELVNHQFLCQGLASEISRNATDLGFGPDSFTLTTHVTITYPGPHGEVYSASTPPSRDEVVLHGRISREELKCSKMETEPCPICLETFSGSEKPITRMVCSHMFHDRCLLEWLSRKHTCPLCRTVLV